MRANSKIKDRLKYRKELVASIAIFLLLLKPSVAKAEEKIDDDKTIIAPNTIPAESANSDSAEEDDKQCHIWGNSYSLKFHLKSCPFAQAMNPRHVQFLKNAREALKLGEKPCRYCLPPYTLDVSCKILAPSVNNNQSDNSAERKAPENGI